LDKKGIAFPRTYIELEVRDKDGKLIDSRAEEAHTWVKVFLVVLNAQMYYGSKPGLQDTNGTLGNCTNWDVNFNVRAPAGDNTFGIVVGTSSLAYSIDQFKLDSQITHGTGSGQMMHGDVTVEDVQSTSGGYLFRVIRVFTNNSGSSITVKEIGLYAKVKMGGSETRGMLARDVLSSPITVPSGSSLTVRYIVSLVP